MRWWQRPVTAGQLLWYFACYTIGKVAGEIIFEVWL